MRAVLPVLILIWGLARPATGEVPGSGISTRPLSDRWKLDFKLGLAEKTIKHYMTNILTKLQVRSRVEAALLAARAGLGQQR